MSLIAKYSRMPVSDDDFKWYQTRFETTRSHTGVIRTTSRWTKNRFSSKLAADWVYFRLTRHHKKDLAMGDKKGKKDKDKSQKQQAAKHDKQAAAKQAKNQPKKP